MVSREYLVVFFLKWVHADQWRELGLKGQILHLEGYILLVANEEPLGRILWHDQSN